MGYPPFIFILIFLALFMSNVLGFVIISNSISKIIAVGVDVFFVWFSYNNYMRIKKRQLPLYVTLFTPKKKIISTDKEQILNIIYKDEGN